MDWWYWVLIGWIVFLIVVVAFLKVTSRGRKANDQAAEAHMVYAEAEKIAMDAAPSDIHRPDWDEYFLLIAQAVASRGECSRSQVGAVIVRDKRIVATGYNGVEAGAPSCLDGICPRANHHVPKGSSYTGLGSCIATHAEENAINDALARGIAVFRSRIYLTKEPCEKCWGLLNRLEIRAYYPPKDLTGERR